MLALYFSHPTNHSLYTTLLPLSPLYVYIQARELFHAAFVSCWHELSEQYQDNLVRSLQKAFRSTTIPAGMV